MARTPLLRSLIQIASDHDNAQRRGVPITKIRDERAREADERAASGVTRRQFVAGAAAAAAALALPRIARGQSSPRIAIVGGGISGVVAAMTLQDAGYASTVYEASGRIGGRMHSNTTTWAGGQVSEWCGEFIDNNNHTIFHLAQRFGLSLTNMLNAQPNGSTDTNWIFGSYYPPSQVYDDFQPVYKVLKSQLQAAPFPTLYNQSTPTGVMLDNLSLYDWIENYVPGGHRSQMGAYLDTAYVNEYGLDSSIQSSLNIVYLLGLQPKPGHLSIYGKSDQAFHIDGGNQQLPQAIAASLPSGSVLTGWRMTSIAKNFDGSYTLKFSTGAGAQTVVADRVILTLPFGVLRGLDYSKAGFDSLKQTAITQLGYGTNSKLTMQFTQRYWNTSGPWGIGDGNIYTDQSFQNSWESTRGYPGASGVLVAAYNGGSDGVAQGSGISSPYTTADSSSGTLAAAQRTLGQLEGPWPGISPYWNGKATLSLPWKDPNRLGSYACWTVGQYTGFSGYERVRQGRCHFAGEHTSINFQGFMEGGAQEGERAANEILADYKSGIFP